MDTKEDKKENLLADMHGDGVHFNKSILTTKETKVKEQEKLKKESSKKND